MAYFDTGGVSNGPTEAINRRSDLFHARISLAFVRHSFDLMGGTPEHTYQLLAKRSGRVRRARPSAWHPSRPARPPHALPQPLTHHPQAPTGKGTKYACASGRDASS